MKDMRITAIRTADGYAFHESGMVLDHDKTRLVHIWARLIPRLTAIAAGLLETDDIELVDGMFYDMFDEDAQKDLARHAMRMIDEKRLDIDEAARRIGEEVFQPDVIRTMMKNFTI